ncbi:MAG: ERCC4 domain-containing protein [Planctomycetes bacterium]|nr:ERCC4 domain-containing protein [Planctomycetota bacterium]
MTDAPAHCPFTVLIDTREQAPWSFRGLTTNADKGYRPLVIDCRSATLPTGDYSIAGFESRIAIERKSLSDAFSTFTHDRERWTRELERMRSYETCHVVIEGSFEELSAGPVKVGGAAVGKAVVRSIMAWSMRYQNVHWWPMASREMAETVAFRLLEKFWEEDQWINKELGKLSIESESQKTPRRSRGSSRQARSLLSQQ